MNRRSYNITSKPHAMDKAVTPTGVFPSTPQTVTYTGFDKVLKVRQGNDSLVYTYGFDHQRIAMEEHVGNTVRTKRYIGNCEYVTESSAGSSASRCLTYLTGPTGVYAVVETRSGEHRVHYVLKDHLGSWTAIADSDGNLEQRLSYDAWGNLRDPATWSGSFTGAPMFDRGFTGHEHLHHFGLINMNGRVYDPVMSSFLSVDQFVQGAGNSQGFNRYAYCLNNPLRYVDPSGWLPWNPSPGTPHTSDSDYHDIYSYVERAYEPRDLGILQLSTDDPTVVWMEENEMHGTGGKEDSRNTIPETFEENPPDGVKVHTGKNLLLKAYWHYQSGGGEDYWVDASTIDLDYISFDDLNENDDGTYWINLFDFSKTEQTALALGKITLTPLGENQYEIHFDKYDFNIEWDQRWTTRNIGTIISGYLHGPVFDNKPVPTHWMGGRPCYAQPSVYFGGPFEIHFSKSVYIRP